VSPRGAGWRRVNRLGVTLAPLSTWALVVALRPGDVLLSRSGWWLLGGATVLLAAGSAALASRRLVPTPGVLLAPVVALATVAPVTLSGMFKWGSLYPIGGFPEAVWIVWACVALSAAAVCVAAVWQGSAPVSTWMVRFAGFSALVNAVGFGGFDVAAIRHFSRDHEVWSSLGNPTYGYGPFYEHGIDTTVPLLLAFLGACALLAVGGGLLLVRRRSGVVVTLAGLIVCTPFWWGFDLPWAWINAATVLLLLSLAWAGRMRTGMRRVRASDVVASSRDAVSGPDHQVTPSAT
jgi:hypothetical protein